MTLIHHRIPERYCTRSVSTYREYSRVNRAIWKWMRENFETGSYRTKSCGSDSYLFSTVENITLFKVMFP